MTTTVLVVLLVAGALALVVWDLARESYVQYDCDRCDATDTVDTWSGRKADRAIRAAGWTYDPKSGECRCPEHVAVQL